MKIKLTRTSGDKAKSMLRGKFIAVSAYTKKKKSERSQIYNLMIHL
jgi:hypothetical protein